MANLPQYEPRPTLGYEIGRWISQTVYTRSFPINCLRLFFIWWTLPQIVLWLGDRGNGLMCALSVAGLILSFCLKPKARKPKPGSAPRWTKEEQRAPAGGGSPGRPRRHAHRGGDQERHRRATGDRLWHAPRHRAARPGCAGSPSRPPVDHRRLRHGQE